MINRFSLSAETGKIVDKFHVRKALQSDTQRFNITPTHSAAIIMNDRHEVRTLQQARWGLFPFWAKDAVNTSYDQMTRKAFLGRMLSRQRCVIPCSGFYGQKQAGHERDARAMHIVLTGKPLFGIAGIFDRWRSPGGEEIRAFTMLTAEMSGAMSVWQPNVPIILDEEGIEEWLHPYIHQIDQLRKHLVPLDSYFMRAYPVTNAVRDDQYESPDCVREIDYA